MGGCGRKAALLLLGSSLVLACYVLLRPHRKPVVGGGGGRPVLESTGRRLKAAGDAPVQVERVLKEKDWHPREHRELSCLSGVVSVRHGGRLGNLLLEYSSAWSLSIQYGLRLAIPSTIMEPLGEVFQNLSANLLEDVLTEPSCSSHRLTASKVLSRAANDEELHPLSRYVTWANDHKQPVILRSTIVLAANIAPVAHMIPEEFLYKPTIAEVAKRTLDEFRHRIAQQTGTQESKVLVVGVHVRRTDYNGYMERWHRVKNVADVGFYRRAAARMRSLLRREAGALVFVVASDDRRWCQTKLLPELDRDFRDGSPASAAFLVPETVSSRDVDLAVLSMVDHSIFAYGTFGTWGALMAGGHTIVFNASAANPNVTPPPKTSSMSFVYEMPSWESLI